MKELAYLLQDVTEDEKQDAIQYYSDYFDEAGPEKEGEILKELQSPERVAALIRAELAGHLEESGEFTDSGYADERFRDPGFQVAKRLDLPEAAGQTAAGGGNKTAFRHDAVQPDGPQAAQPLPPRRTSRGLKLLLWIILIIVAFPLLLGIGGGLLGILITLAGVLAAALFGLAALSLASLIGGIVMIPMGLFGLIASLADGLLTFGTGLALIGGGLLLLALSILFYGKFIPFLFCSLIDFLSRLFHRRREHV